MAGLNMRAETAAKGPKKPKKEVDHVRVAEAKNGGHTAYHHHKAEYEHPPEGPHIFPKGEAHPVKEGHLFHHLAKHLGIPHTVVSKEAAAEHEPDEMEEEEMSAE